MTKAMSAAEREDRVLERIDKFRQRRPRLLDEVVTLAHGAGGKSSAALVDAVFLEAFRNAELEQLGDAAALRTPSGDRLAFSTDSYVVSAAALSGRVDRPRRGARHDQRPRDNGGARRSPLLAAGFVLEEGFPIERCARDRRRHPQAPRPRAGVSIVTGDTKVVDRGAADGMYISTVGCRCRALGTGGSTAAGVEPPGDVVIQSRARWPTTESP